MQELKTRLAEELPHIEKAIERMLCSLPKPVQGIGKHIFDAGGKRLRPFLCVLMARMFGYTKADIYDLAISMEMLHAATLLHDDVLDKADTRRGKPAAHTLYTVTSTILAGDALLAAANALVAGFGDVRLCHCFSEATMHTAAGEILEIEYLHNIDQDAKIYEEIVLGKTAWLLRASCVLGALQAQAKDNDLHHVAEYGQGIGMAFQMVDDALDFAPESITGKPTGGDLREGKLTPPVRLYREYLQGKDREAFDAAFVNGTFTIADAARIGEEICRLGYDVKTRKMASAALQNASDALASLPQSPEHTLLQQMILYVQQRQK